MAILKVKNLSTGYRGVDVLHDISFEVKKGDYFCIIGSNGSGKSTLIKCLLGLVPHSSGQIEFGVNNQEIAYLPQISTIPREMPATVKEVIMTGLQKSGKRLPFYTKKDVLHSHDSGGTPIPEKDHANRVRLCIHKRTPSKSIFFSVLWRFPEFRSA